MNNSRIEQSLFDHWIQKNKKSITRSDKYSKTLATITNDLNKTGTDLSDLYLVKDVEEANRLKVLYFSIPEFYAKNQKGNRMYSRSFDLFIEYLEQLVDNAERDISDIFQDKKTSETEKKTLILARIGQGKYREQLIKIWGKCSISEFPDHSLLIASHIKPWRVAEPHEKVDPFNGLLLLPNYDKVFDKGLISFNTDGKILISSILNQTETLGLNMQIKINLHKQNMPYMEYHASEVFKSY